MIRKILNKIIKEKVIVDTNIFVGANWAKGSASYRIIEALQKDKLKLIYSDDIYRENRLILGKAKIRKEFNESVEEIFKKGIKVTPKLKIKMIKDDPDDDKYLSCAKESNAKYIISNDKHLLDIRKFGKTKIIRSSEFIQKSHS